MASAARPISAGASTTQPDRIQLEEVAKAPAADRTSTLISTRNLMRFPVDDLPWLNTRSENELLDRIKDLEASAHSLVRERDAAIQELASFKASISSDITREIGGFKSAISKDIESFRSSLSTTYISRISEVESALGMTRGPEGVPTSAAIDSIRESISSRSAEAAHGLSDRDAVKLVKIAFLDLEIQRLIKSSVPPPRATPSYAAIVREATDTAKKEATREVQRLIDRTNIDWKNNVVLYGIQETSLDPDEEARDFVTNIMKSHAIRFSARRRVYACTDFFRIWNAFIQDHGSENMLRATRDYSPQQLAYRRRCQDKVNSLRGADGDSLRIRYDPSRESFVILRPSGTGTGSPP
ncbi:hypothetical protein YB2330_006330 [Saitoella coloradoensis]